MVNMLIQQKGAAGGARKYQDSSSVTRSCCAWTTRLALAGYTLKAKVWARLPSEAAPPHQSNGSQVYSGADIRRTDCLRQNENPSSARKAFMCGRRAKASRQTETVVNRRWKARAKEPVFSRQCIKMVRLSPKKNRKQRSNPKR